MAPTVPYTVATFPSWSTEFPDHAALALSCTDQQQDLLAICLLALRDGNVELSSPVRWQSLSFDDFVTPSGKISGIDVPEFFQRLPGKVLTAAESVHGAICLRLETVGSSSVATAIHFLLVEPLPPNGYLIPTKLYNEKQFGVWNLNRRAWFEGEAVPQQAITFSFDKKNDRVVTPDNFLVDQFGEVLGPDRRLQLYGVGEELQLSRVMRIRDSLFHEFRTGGGNYSRVIRFRDRSFPNGHTYFTPAQFELFQAMRRTALGCRIELSDPRSVGNECINKSAPHLSASVPLTSGEVIGTNRTIALRVGCLRGKDTKRLPIESRAVLAVEKPTNDGLWIECEIGINSQVHIRFVGPFPSRSDRFKRPLVALPKEMFDFWKLLKQSEVSVSAIPQGGRIPFSDFIPPNDPVFSTLIIMPDLTYFGRSMRFGAPIGSTSVDVVGCTFFQGEGHWIQMEFLTPRGTERLVSLLQKDCTSGTYSIDRTYTPKQFALWRLYREARECGEARLPESGFSIGQLINRHNGAPLSLFLGSTGQPGSHRTSLRIGNPVTDGVITRLYDAGDGETLRADVTGIGDSKRRSAVRILRDGVVPVLPPGDSRSADTLKGLLLDAVVLQALRSSGYQRRSFQAGDLYDEVFEPNLISQSGIVHCKWGSQPTNAFQYALKYDYLCRARLAHLPAVRCVLWETTWKTELNSAADRVEREVSNARLTFLGLREFLQSEAIDPASVIRRIAAIEERAERNDVEWLREQMTTLGGEITGAVSSAVPLADTARWQERIVRRLHPTSLDAFGKEMSALRESHSMWNHLHYHYRMGAYLSFVLDMISDGSVRGQSYQAIRAEVLEFYPCLIRFPRAWELLCAGEGSVASAAPTDSDAYSDIAFDPQPVDMEELLTKLCGERTPQTAARLSAGTASAGFHFGPPRSTAFIELNDSFRRARSLEEFVQCSGASPNNSLSPEEREDLISMASSLLINEFCRSNKINDLLRENLLANRPAEERLRDLITCWSNDQLVFFGKRYVKADVCRDFDLIANHLRGPVRGGG